MLDKRLTVGDIQELKRDAQEKIGKILTDLQKNTGCDETNISIIVIPNNCTDGDFRINSDTSGLRCWIKMILT